MSFWIVFGSYLWWCYEKSKIAKDVEENGVEVPAKIIELFYAKGWTSKIEYYYDGKKYNGNGVSYACDSRKPEDIPRLGDSLIVKILPKEPDKFILVKKVFFSKPRKP